MRECGLPRPECHLLKQSAGAQGGTKQLKKAAQQPKKAASKAASPLKKAVPKSSVGTKRIGKRSGGGGSSGGETLTRCSCAQNLSDVHSLSSHIFCQSCCWMLPEQARRTSVTDLCGADALWLPNTERPSWLDGSLPGDRGFDPLGLAKPTEYLQVDCTYCWPLSAHAFVLAGIMQTASSPAILYPIYHKPQATLTSA